MCDTTAAKWDEWCTNELFIWTYICCFNILGEWIASLLIWTSYEDVNVDNSSFWPDKPVLSFKDRLSYYTLACWSSHTLITNKFTNNSDYFVTVAILSSCNILYIRQLVLSDHTEEVNDGSDRKASELHVGLHSCRLVRVPMLTLDH